MHAKENTTNNLVVVRKIRVQFHFETCRNDICVYVFFWLWMLVNIILYLDDLYLCVCVCSARVDWNINHLNWFTTVGNGDDLEGKFSRCCVFAFLMSAFKSLRTHSLENNDLCFDRLLSVVCEYVHTWMESPDRNTHRIIREVWMNLLRHDDYDLVDEFDDAFITQSKQMMFARFHSHQHSHDVDYFNQIMRIVFALCNINRSDLKLSNYWVLYGK